MASREVLYAFARGRDGAVVHVEQSEHAGPFTCIGCDATLVAKGLRDGAKVQPHYSHLAVVDEAACSPETALHRLSKALVAEGHARARRNGIPYRLTWRCTCSDERSIDCAADFDEVKQEVRLLDHVTSDLAFSGSTTIALEIVVTHSTEPNTLSRYKRAGMPVFEFVSTWDNVASLLDGVNAVALYMHDDCPGCAQARKPDDSRVDNDPMAILERFERSLWNKTLGSDEAAAETLGAWPFDVDRHGMPMHEAHRNALRRQALLLTRIGFRQAADQPWRFRWVLEGIGSAEVELSREKWEGAWLNGLARRLAVQHQLPRVGRVTETLKRIVRHHLSEHDVCLDDEAAWHKRVASFLIASGR